MGNPFGKPAEGDSGKGKKFSIDFSDMQSGFNIEEGHYPAKCIDVAEGQSKAGNDMLTFTFAIMEGEYVGKEFKNFCAITPAALWKLAETLGALGVEVTEGVANFDPDDCLNKACVLEIEDSEYNGNVRSSIKTVHPHEKGPNIYDISLAKAGKK